jgi:hypothetical protein
VAAFQKQKPECFVSWARRPAPRTAPNQQESAPKATEDSK